MAKNSFSDAPDEDLLESAAAVGADDYEIGLPRSDLFEDRLYGGAHHEFEVCFDTGGLQCFYMFFEIPVLALQFIGAGVPHRLGSHFVADKVRILRSNVKQGETGREGIGQLHRTTNHGFGKVREIDGCEDVFHDKVSLA